MSEEVTGLSEAPVEGTIGKNKADSFKVQELVGEDECDEKSEGIKKVRDMVE